MKLLSLDRRLGYGFAVSFFVLLLMLFFERAYLVNDNIGIISDLKASTPVSFMTILFGQGLSVIYRLSDNMIPVFGSVFYLINMISIASVLYAFSYLVDDKKILFMLSFTYLSFHIFYLINLDFTLSGIMLTGSSLFLILSLSFSNKLTKFNALLWGVFFAGGYLIRKDIIFVIAVFFLPLILFVLWKNNTKRMNFLLFLLPLLIFFSVNRFMVNNLLRDNSYKNFKEYNKVRGQFHGFPVAEKNIGNVDILKYNNWTDNDYAMFMDWTFLDENKFSVDKIKKIFEYSLPPEKEKSIGQLLSKGMEKIVKKYDTYLFFWGALLLLIIITYNSRQLLLPFTYYIYIFFCGVYMTVFLRFPGRIGYPILLICGLLPLSFLFVEKSYLKEKGRNCGKYIIIGMLLFLSFINVRRFIYQNNLNRGNKQIFDREYRKFQQLFKDKVLIIQPGAALNYKYSDPLKVYDNSYITIPLGWGIFSPHFYRVVEKIGLKKASDVLPFAIDNDKMIFIGDKVWCEMIVLFIKETYGRECALILDDNYSNGVIAAKLKSR